MSMKLPKDTPAPYTQKQVDELKKKKAAEKKPR
jgi:hypothetical protein